MTFIQELTAGRDKLQATVTTLQTEVTMKDQQLAQCQEEMNKLSRKHEVAVNEGNSLREQVEQFEKLVPNWHQNLTLLIAIFCRSIQSTSKVSYSNVCSIRVFSGSVFVCRIVAQAWNLLMLFCLFNWKMVFEANFLVSMYHTFVLYKISSIKISRRFLSTWPLALIVCYTSCKWLTYS